MIKKSQSILAAYHSNENKYGQQPPTLNDLVEIDEARNSIIDLSLDQFDLNKSISSNYDVNYYETEDAWKLLIDSNGNISDLDIQPTMVKFQLSKLTNYMNEDESSKSLPEHNIPYKVNEIVIKVIRV